MPRSVIAEIDNVVTNVAPDDNGIATFRFQNGEIGILLPRKFIHHVARSEYHRNLWDRRDDYPGPRRFPSTNSPRPANAVALRMFRKGDSLVDRVQLFHPTQSCENGFLEASRGPLSITLKA